MEINGTCKYRSKLYVFIQIFCLTENGDQFIDRKRKEFAGRQSDKGVLECGEAVHGFIQCVVTVGLLMLSRGQGGRVIFRGQGGGAVFTLERAQSSSSLLHV